MLLVLASFAGAQERALHKEVVVAAPIAEVWRAWTTREGVTSFFAPGAEIEARVGGAFHVHFDPFAAPGAKGADDMRYMALQAPTMLSFDWNAPPHLPQVRQQRSFVIVRLKELEGTSTRVSLHHVGWGEGAEWDQAHAYFDRAWGAVLANLKKRFESGPIDWSAWLEQLRKMHAQPAAIASQPAR
ncbi:SRPBCC domain-containing protein [Variovorax sp. YR752]|uniref:SRPBCC family protein n=1 Tax=Variovorax sp. YR752 TaxID=1884383 RepID=UPI003137CB7A